MPSRSELVGHGRSPSEIAEVIGADLVIFQTLPDLITACRQFNSSIEKFDTSIFDGHYVSGGVDEAYLSYMENLRGDNLKERLPAEEVGGINAAEGKGGGGLKTAANGISKIAVPPLAVKSRYDAPTAAGNAGMGNETPTGVSTPMDDNVGLHNSWLGGVAAR
jgi:amidophosphoribosyltransferase